MVIAGIDEAGYGPLLGPLVVGCCAFEVDAAVDASADAAGICSAADAAEVAEGPNESEINGADRTAAVSGTAEVPALGAAVEGELPCLWKRLGRYVSRNRTKSGRKIHVNDSKIVYSPAGGLKELERSVLALASAAYGGWEPDLADLGSLLGRVAGHCLQDLPEYAWYQPAADERFPLAQEAMPVKLFANALRQQMAAADARCVELAARVVFERQLNRMLEATRNKAGALFSVSAIHLDRLLRAYGDRGLVVVCDRQGGREHYGSLLRLMFDEWSLEVLREGDGHSEYRLHRGGHVVRLVFRERAEAACLPVAVASMLSKYLREALMHRFNAYWRQHLPELTPTAGYYGDGTRFLQDIDAKRQELGIRDEELIRSR